MVGAEHLKNLPSLINEIGIGSMPDDQLNHIQGLMQRRPHQRGPTVLILYVEICTFFYRSLHTIIVIIPGRSLELLVHLLNGCNHASHFQLLLRVVVHRQASFVCLQQVQTIGQKSLHHG